MATVDRVKGRTPNGGAYSEIHYLDRSGNPVDPKDAYQMIIWECTEDGKIICTTSALAGGG